jgi:hypothetical protein
MGSPPHWEKVCLRSGCHVVGVSTAFGKLYALPDSGLSMIPPFHEEAEDHQNQGILEFLSLSFLIFASTPML